MPQQELSLLDNAFVQFAIYPLETIRTRLAVCPPGTYCGLRHAALTIWRSEGAFGFYRGLVPSLVRPLCLTSLGLRWLHRRQCQMQSRHTSSGLGLSHQWQR